MLKINSSSHQEHDINLADLVWAVSRYAKVNISVEELLEEGRCEFLKPPFFPRVTGWSQLY